MGLGYKLIENYGGKDKESEMLSMEGVINRLLYKLKHINCLCNLSDGYFEETVCIKDNSIHTKRFIVITNVPKGKFMIKKISKGSFDKEIFIHTLNYIKEKYYERV